MKWRRDKGDGVAAKSSQLQGRPGFPVVRLPPDVRRPANNGDDSLEIEIEGDWEARTPEVRSALDELIPQIPAMAAYAFDNAPSDWHDLAAVRTADGEDSELWLDAAIFGVDGRVHLRFDFGDLVQLELTLHPDGLRTVTLEP